MTNYVRDQITKQLSTRSGMLVVTNQQGGYQYTDSTNGKPVSGTPVASSFLANPPKISDPKITSAAITAAQGNIIGNNIPPQLSNSLAAVAAYVSVVNNINVQQLFVNNLPTLQLLSGYNTFKPKGSQLGVFGPIGQTVWQTNPTLRGTIALIV